MMNSQIALKPCVVSQPASQRRHGRMQRQINAKQMVQHTRAWLGLHPFDSWVGGYGVGERTSVLVIARVRVHKDRSDDGKRVCSFA